MTFYYKKSGSKECTSPQFSWQHTDHDMVTTLDAWPCSGIGSFGQNYTRKPPCCPVKCDNCLKIKFDDNSGGSDVMCLNKKQECIWSGNLVQDGSYVAVTSHLNTHPIPQYDYEDCKSEKYLEVRSFGSLAILLKGRNHDGVNARRGIVSHGLREDSMGIIPEVFVHKLFGNVSQNQWEHFPLLTNLKLYYNNMRIK